MISCLPFPPFCRIKGPDFCQAALVTVIEEVEDIFDTEGFIHNHTFYFFGMCFLPDLKAVRCRSKNCSIQFLGTLLYLEVFIFYYIKTLIWKFVLSLSDSANASTKLPWTICAEWLWQHSFMASFTLTQRNFFHSQIGILLPLCRNCELHSENISCRRTSSIEEQTRFIFKQKVVTCRSLASHVIF